MKLSEQCIEAIEKASPYLNPMDAMEFTNGATEALTNPSIYSKAGLISLEELDEFLKWVDNKWPKDGSYIHNYTFAQLFQIYQEQKEK